MDTFPSSITPDRITGGEQSGNTTIIKFEGKAEQRFANQHDVDEKYMFNWSFMTPAEFATLKQFHRTQLGAFKAWTIQDDRIAPYAVACRFESDAMSYDLVKGKYANVSVEVVIR